MFCLPLSDNYAILLFNFRRKFSSRSVTFALSIESSWHVSKECQSLDSRYDSSTLYDLPWRKVFLRYVKENVQRVSRREENCTNVTATKQVETKCIYTFLVIVFEAILRDCASFEYGVGQLGTSCGRNSSQFQRVWSRPQSTQTFERVRKGIGQKTAPLFFGSSRIDETTNHQITAIHLEPCNRAIFLSFEPLSRGTRQRRDGSNRAKQTQRDASHECQPATPDLFLSSPLSVFAARRDPIQTERKLVQKHQHRSRSTGGGRVGRGEGGRGQREGSRRRPKVRATTETTPRPRLRPRGQRDDAATQGLSPDCGRPPALLPFRFSPLQPPLICSFFISAPIYITLPQAFAAQPISSTQSHG